MFVKISYHFNTSNLRRYFEKPNSFNCWIYAKYGCYFYTYFDIRTFDVFIVDFHLEKEFNLNKALKSIAKEIKNLQFDFLYSIHDLGSKSFQKLDTPNIQFHFGNKYSYNFLLV